MRPWALLQDVHMHSPRSRMRPFVDSLQAFFPGLQVLKGDVLPAIHVHRALTRIIEQHGFLPEVGAREDEGEGEGTEGFHEILD